MDKENIEQNNNHDSDYSITSIVRSTGSDPELARLLYEFTRGDEEGVRRILSAVPKNILVIKGKFIAQKRQLFGLFVIFYDLNKSEIIRVVGVVAIDREISREEIRSDFDRLVEFIQDYSSTSQTSLWDRIESEGLLARIKQVLEAEYWPKLFRESRADVLELELVKAIDRTLMKFLNDNQVAIKIDIEKINEFQFTKCFARERENLFSQNDGQEGDAKSDDEETAPDKNLGQSKSYVMLQCEPELSPVSGTEAAKLEVGDDILVRIIDSRDIARYIKSLLLQQKGYRSEQSNENPPIAGIIKDKISLETGNVRFIVEFGPGIMGQLHCQQEIKILQERKKDDKSKGDDKDKTDQGQINLYFWGIILSALALGVVLLFMFLSGN